MSRRHADIWSHPSHYLVDPYTWPWSPNGQDHIWPSKFKYQGHGQGQTHWSYLRPRVQINMFAFCFVAIGPVLVEIYKISYFTLKFKVRVAAKVKSDGHFWGQEFNRCVCFSFCGNRTIFGRDIANSIFDLENSGSRSCPRSNPMVTFEVLRSIDMFAFVSWQSDHFWLRYSEFHIWPWKFKVKWVSEWLSLMAFLEQRTTRSIYST